MVARWDNSVQKSVETTAIRSLRRLKALYTFCRSLANTWDLHELTIARHGKELLDRLDETTLQQDAANQAMTGQLCRVSAL